MKLINNKFIFNLKLILLFYLILSSQALNQKKQQRGFGDFMGSIKNAAQNAANSLKQGAQNALNDLKQGAQNAVNQIKQGVNDLKNKAMSLLNKQPQKPWCWVQPDPADSKKVWDFNVGGPNWAFVDQKSLNRKQQYTIIVKTPSLQGAEASEQFSIILIGDQGVTETQVLTNQGFEKGSIFKKQIQGISVGNVEQVRLKTTGTTKYQCEYIQVEIGPTFWKFDCTQPIFCPLKCSADYQLVGAQKYMVNIQTSKAANSGTKQMVYMKLIGDKGQGTKKILSLDGFQTGKLKEIEFRDIDVGELEGVELSLANEDKWLFTSIQISSAGHAEMKVENKDGWQISCPQKCSLEVMNKISASTIDSQEEYDQLKQDKDQISQSTMNENGQQQGPMISKETLENTYDGSTLSPVEKKKIAILTCDDSMFDNPVFGPKFQSYNVNAESFLVQCPIDCEKSIAKVYGVGIHPQESSICKTALIDKAMPLQGGIIGVTVLKGQQFYEASKKKILGIQSQEFSKSDKSFFTYKIDNIDMVESDIRIINQNGQITNNGRLEFRQNGVWGSISAKGMNQDAARTICQMLHYKDGILKNFQNKNSIEICKDYQGQDYCGSEYSPIYFSDINCNQGERDVFKCVRKVATKENTHLQDAIVECTSKDFNYSPDPIDGTLRIVDFEDKIAGVTNEGRLELFKKGKWGTICNINFGDFEATVSCKQMGYNVGKVIGGAGKNGVCQNFQNKNYCGKNKIQASLQSCKGNEDNIKQCDLQITAQGCNHGMDVIISCEGNGDPSGNSQQEQVTQKAPLLGKLPIIPEISLGCSNRADEPRFRGDAGSIFLVKCPENCVDQQGIVWGTSVYSLHSSICRAGLHSGILRNRGGLAILVKLDEQSSFLASTNNEIQSLAEEKKTQSFSIAKANSIIKHLSNLYQDKLKIFNENKGKGFGLNRQNLLLKPQMFLQISSSQQSTVRASNDEKIPIFEWYKPDSKYKFDDSTQLSLDGINGIEKTAYMQQFTITTRAFLDKNEQKQTRTLISHSGCGCYNLQVENEDQQIVFEKQCTGPKFKTGFYMPINQYTTISITYDGNQMSFYENGELRKQKALEFEFQCPQKLNIGSKEGTSQFWHGLIDFVKIHQVALPSYEIHKLSLLDYTSKPFQANNAVAATTTDGRQCISPVITAPTPGKQGAPIPPKQAELGQSNYANGNIDFKEGMDEKEISQSMKDFVDTNKIEAVDAKFDLDAQNRCKVKGNQFQGPSEQKFSIHCPAKCLDVDDNYVYGTQIYEESSSVCLAAIHAGIIQNDQGGQVEVIIANGVQFYQGSKQNGVNSLNFGASVRSFLVHEDAQQNMQKRNLQCSDTGTFSNELNSKFIIQCASQCSSKEGKVYGDQIYTADSSICRAAIHAGILSDLGGEVSLMIIQGKSNYKAKKSNGIDSEEKAEFVRSFTFLGNKANKCNYFEEKFDPADIKQNWQNFDYTGQTSEWSFNTHPTMKDKLSISQNSPAKGDFKSQKYGTVLLKKDFDCNQGLFKFNVFYGNPKGLVAILFRIEPNERKDFISLELNYDQNKGIRLVQMSKGLQLKVQEIKGANIEYNEWLRFSIGMDQSNITIYYQIGNLRQVDKILTYEDTLQSKGSVGFATDDGDGVHFDGVGFQQYDKNDFEQQKIVLQENSYSFDKCLNPTTLTQDKIKKYCQKRYRSFDAIYRNEFEKDCLFYHNYCQFCCDEIVNRIENIQNYACKRKCIQVAKQVINQNNAPKQVFIQKSSISHKKKLHHKKNKKF